MLCLKILVIFITVCQCQIIHFKKELNIEHHGLPAKILKYIHDHWPMIKIETRAGIQKRDLQDVPFRVELPAPVVEPELEKQMETVLYGFKKPEPVAAPGLNTNIQFSMDSSEMPGPLPINGEMFGGLPPPPVYAPIIVPPELPPPVPEVPVQVPEPPPTPPRVEPVPPPVERVPPPVEPVPPPAEPVPPNTVKTKVRKVAVYAGDVILKYLSQFFNRARITFNRFTSPPPPTPEFENK